MGFEFGLGWPNLSQQASRLECVMRSPLRFARDWLIALPRALELTMEKVWASSRAIESVSVRAMMSAFERAIESVFAKVWALESARVKRKELLMEM